MAQASELARIAERRRTLVEQSGAIRQRLGEECSNLHGAAGWIDTGYSWARSFRSWWPLAAAGLGLLIGKRGTGLVRNAGKLWSWWRVLKQASGLWRQFFAGSGSAQAPGRAKPG